MKMAEVWNSSIFFIASRFGWIFFFIWFLYIWILFSGIFVSGLYFDSLKFVKIKFCQCIFHRFTNTLSLFCVCKQSFTFVFVGFCIQRVGKKRELQIEKFNSAGSNYEIGFPLFHNELFVHRAKTYHKTSINKRFFILIFN